MSAIAPLQTAAIAFLGNGWVSPENYNAIVRLTLRNSFMDVGVWFERRSGIPLEFRLCALVPGKGGEKNLALLASHLRRLHPRVLVIFIMLMRYYNG
ncbi:hypothetical protein BJP34_08925 [Moorena producens PAL-8-15-08-1]|uniref:Uncharacterized protein n=1 Tax=Moorena producens PAL-8-15-08-1 TaxID=1458985 RepID=A0A1D8TPI0_9CYAN|nr:hypothetical protein BJP34_08925 [Moorena producens PAL-8-15-08-1]